MKNNHAQVLRLSAWHLLLGAGFFLLLASCFPAAPAPSPTTTLSVPILSSPTTYSLLPTPSSQVEEPKPDSSPPPTLTPSATFVEPVAKASPSALTPTWTPEVAWVDPVATAFFSGPFSNEVALHSLYPNPETRVSDLEVQIPRTVEGGIVTNTLQVILSESYWEDGRMEHVILLASDWLKGLGRYRGAPLIGVIFVWEAERWKLEIAQSNFAELGQWGYPPDVRLVRIGPRKYGYLFQIESGMQGGSNISLELYAPLQGGIVPLLGIGGVRVEVPDLLGPNQTVIKVKSTYGFVAGHNPEYYDFAISTWRNDKNATTFEHRVYSFNGTQYTEQKLP